MPLDKEIEVVAESKQGDKYTTMCERDGKFKLGPFEDV